MNNKLRGIIFKKLYSDLSHVEIIDLNDRIWFIDRGKKYWYFEYKKSGVLWWRYDFFTNFFVLFSIEQSDFEPIISDWVEEVLNRNVTTTVVNNLPSLFQVEEVLNRNVTTTLLTKRTVQIQVEEVLNCKVTTTNSCIISELGEVEEVLNHNGLMKVI